MRVKTIAAIALVLGAYVLAGLAADALRPSKADAGGRSELYELTRAVEDLERAVERNTDAHQRCCH